jgi:hypothetical protein
MTLTVIITKFSFGQKNILILNVLDSDGIKECLRFTSQNQMQFNKTITHYFFFENEYSKYLKSGDSNVNELTKLNSSIHFYQSKPLPDLSRGKPIQNPSFLPAIFESIEYAMNLISVEKLVSISFTGIIKLYVKDYEALYCNRKYSRKNCANRALIRNSDS